MDYNILVAVDLEGLDTGQLMQTHLQTNVQYNLGRLT